MTHLATWPYIQPDPHYRQDKDIAGENEPRYLFKMFPSQTDKMQQTSYSLRLSQNYQVEFYTPTIIG